MKIKKPTVALRGLLQTIKTESPEECADVIIESLISEDLLDEVIDRLSYWGQQIATPTSSQLAAIKGNPTTMTHVDTSQAIDDTIFSTTFIKDEYENKKKLKKRKQGNQTDISKGGLVKQTRRNRGPIVDLDNEQVMQAAKKLVTCTGIFVTQPNEHQSSLIRYEFTTDTRILEKSIPKTCKAYMNNTKMVFFAEVARAVAAIIYHLQMETLKRIGANHHAEMLDRIRERNVLSNSELNRLKTLGNRMYKLTRECGLASLAVLSCVSCSRIIECTNETFDRFVTIVHQNNFCSYETMDFNDPYFKQFQQFYQASITHNNTI